MKLPSFATAIMIALLGTGAVAQFCNCRDGGNVDVQRSEFCCLWSPGDWSGGAAVCLLSQDKLFRMVTCCQEVGRAVNCQDS
ncbi:hypothetical protein QBC47DRAFT_216922 [Echria macrotheca]|uniref:Uncharacterized protein n=1 Tax=Echria macrotheca TaxID=438768 RepID=A0AAJ0BEF4_9PEZI|nr:hypothetical protein QBC47DRAFT_216922 [Echria macrotheca]